MFDREEGQTFLPGPLAAMVAL
ncbi:hypothetical protein SKA53_00385 [Yoonia vestfoldensis SKA53]|uniref:Uncharacterized protein n=1 Tax=Yoonia vestfoldensis SKA53 TaxID=314232 RepID=A3V924_9RHOB|nr:hypothetical protein SKA53_00385 [Yoonia vestfoldensis SKA53]